MSEHDIDDDNTEDVESAARKLGWSPREKWRGKPEEFVEAEEFLRRGREVLPIVRSQVDQTRAENERLKQELANTRADFDRRFKTNERMTQRMLEQQRAQIVSEFEAQKRDAVAKGDVAAFDRVTRQEQATYTKMAEEAKEAAPPAPHAPAHQDVDPPKEVQDWAGRNQWFFQDRAMAMEAEALHIAFQRDHPGLGLAENLDRVTETMKQRYPQKFGISPPSGRERGFSAVEGTSSGRGASNTRERGWKDLPAEARGACNQLIESGHLKGDAKKVQEDYARTYWEEYGG
jgi:hypothetical protein